MAMIFQSERRLPLPTEDLLSYVFDKPPYDQDEPIYIDAHAPSRSISCNQARKRVRQLIKGLRKAGLQKGDCVAVHAFNNIYYSIFVLAIIGAGGIFTGTNPSSTPPELVHHLRTSRARFIVSELSAELLGPLMLSAKEVSIHEDNIWFFDVHDTTGVYLGLHSWMGLLAHGEDDWIRFNGPDFVQSITAVRFFSSGTTGLPKAVDITHHNILAQHALVFEAHPRPYRITSLVALPVFHAAIAPLVHFGALRSGYTTYVMRRFEPGPYLDLIKKYNITDLIVVPPILTAILHSNYPGKDNSMKKLKSVVCGAAPLDKGIQSRVRTLLADGVPLTQAWGMTETCCASMMFPYPENDDTGSVGRLIPNVQAMLVDDSGSAISDPKTGGELCIRGSTVTPGYFDNPAANKDTFMPDGWLKTGDVARCDPVTQKWYITGRKKELIKVRGFQVAPAELEAVLLSHPEIADAVVIGVPVSFLGEAPRAFVVRRPGSVVSAAEVMEYAAGQLAGYKRLAGGVRFVDIIPRNASGKILRQVLGGTRGYGMEYLEGGGPKL